MKNCKIIALWGMLYFFATASDFVECTSSSKSLIPPNWKKLQLSQLSRLLIGGQEFYLAGLETDWYTAKHTCSDAGLRLLQINTAAKQSLVNAVLNTEQVNGLIWIGLSDAALEGQWRWADGSLALYTNWGGCLANSIANNCAHIVGIDYNLRYKWVADNCIELRDFICETY